jgi:hypothetical protein
MIAVDALEHTAAPGGLYGLAVEAIDLKGNRGGTRLDLMLVDDR